MSNELAPIRCYGARMPEPKLPCVILVRENSKRLPGKAFLQWKGTTLLRNCIMACLACENVGEVIVASDGVGILDHVDGADALERVMGHEPDVGYGATLRAADGRLRTWKRPEVPDDQTSLDGLRQVQEGLGLQASYILLAQATSPFISPADLSRLVLCADLPCPGVAALGKRGRPSGMGYVVPPFIEDAAPRAFVEQDAPEIDVDVLADYERALSLCQ